MYVYTHINTCTHTDTCAYMVSYWYVRQDVSSYVISADTPYHLQYRATPSETIRQLIYTLLYPSAWLHWYRVLVHRAETRYVHFVRTNNQWDHFKCCITTLPSPHPPFHFGLLQTYISSLFLIIKSNHSSLLYHTFLLCCDNVCACCYVRRHAMHCQYSASTLRTTHVQGWVERTLMPVRTW